MTNLNELKSLTVWCVEYKKYGDDYDFKIFKTEAEANQFADEFRMGCMREEEIVEMKALKLNSEEYCFNELIAVAIVSKQVAEIAEYA